jgi:sec-independent protein translocase protein TatA
MHLLSFVLPGHFEWIVILMVGLLLFGKRLPEVGRSVGKSIVEFKKGIKGIEEDIDDASAAKQIKDHKSYRSTPEIPSEVAEAPDTVQRTEAGDVIEQGPREEGATT